ncbi:hypothetical protein [Helicobacter apodemus]|uniref:DUF1640 domain-containing protein n=1 Tax=Helicobacter apodemus TaxID=135569 RepID=A0A2U8FE88_9HELI|nr:hypothetical protein [Helicobacter apodemus]AWI33725.1 hypothetical protein CDV25_02335 [Helicobacter apodemus]
MQGNMMQVIQPNHTISQSTIALIMKLIKKSYKEEEQQEVLNDIVAIVDEVKRDNRISSELIREEVVEKLKGELATKDFVRAEIAGVRTEIAKTQTKQMWFVIYTGIASAVVIIGANFAMVKFLLETLGK